MRYGSQGHAPSELSINVADLNEAEDSAAIAAEWLNNQRSLRRAKITNAEFHAYRYRRGRQLALFLEDILRVGGALVFMVVTCSILYCLAWLVLQPFAINPLDILLMS